ncbi:carboxypeptidase M32 [Vulgatibacter incomptus]|uniref:Metal-dependent carboxypeptidase n=1 Tax=Vulgatibacter incomptus TaxID=1391653 RepID=A0A0K1P866_9BACT|nr:carboxypeptidase M32 [Vulgatibacter incomptus]AKU89713.1 Thermostable carboxypeptidase 1 [Vulgatibacter incomptus]
MDDKAWNELSRRMAELRDLGSIVGLLTWDQETFMPPGGADGRARQLAALQSLIHERLVSQELGDGLAAAAIAPGLDGAKAAMVRNLTRERDRAVKVPARLVRELAERQSKSVEAWRAARADGGFATFAPHLARLLELRREQADVIGHDGERYDALLEGFEPGMRVARLEPIFAELRDALIRMVAALADAPPPPRWRVERHRFPVDRQWDFTLHLLRDMGFDFERGRQDRSTHPFTDGIWRGDVRLTTRLSEENPFQAIFGTIHEGGHGLYEQNLPEEHAHDPVGHAASMGLHESQSRLWENLVGRSLPFWQRQHPHLRRAFPEALEGVSVEEVYAAANRVERSLVRVEADEVTYNLHILVRFELELAMLRGDLAVADLPAAWDERMMRYLGVKPDNDVEGVLQDIHWAWAELGYFPTYTLGNLYSAILYEKLAADLGDVDEVVRSGELTRIRDWLVENVHRHGHRWDAEEIVRRATGAGLSTAPFLRHLRTKYRSLYGATLAP